MNILKWQIKLAAKKYGFDWKLIAAIVAQESGGIATAVRYEPRFYERYVEGKKSKDLAGHCPQFFPTLPTELKLRAFSFGLMQIMGQTARECGFNKNYLTDLLKPSINLNVGCSYLRFLYDKFTNDSLPHNDRIYLAIAKYNGGPGNPQEHYAARVLKRIEDGTYIKAYQ